MRGTILVLASLAVFIASPSFGETHHKETKPKPAPAKPAPAASFDFASVTKRADKLAAVSWEEPPGAVPDWLTKMSYGQWRDSRFKADQTLWAGQKLQVRVQVG